MESRGWIVEDPETTGREKTFLLTEDGKALVEKILPVRMAVQQRMMSALTEEEMNLLLTLCNKLKALS
jgi:DNA-binding MarR family transcriptional regulator